MFGSNEINVTNKHTIPLHLDFRKETQKDCTYALDGFICRGCLNLEYYYLCEQIEGLISRGTYNPGERGGGLNMRFYCIPVTPEMK